MLGTTAVVLLIATLQFTTEVVVVRHYGLALIFITPLALTIAASGNTDDPVRIVGERIVDTLLGAVIGVLVFWCDEWRRSGRRRN